MSDVHAYLYAAHCFYRYYNGNRPGALLPHIENIILSNIESVCVSAVEESTDDHFCALFFRVVASHQSITRLSVFCNDHLDNKTKTVVDGITGNHRLKALILHDVTMSCDLTASMCNWAQAVQLRRLELQDVRVSGLTPFCELIETSRYLQWLTLYTEDVSLWQSAEVSRFLAALEQNFTLKFIGLSGFSGTDVLSLAKRVERRNLSIKADSMHEFIVDTAVALSLFQLPLYVIFSVVECFPYIDKIFTMHEMVSKIQNVLLVVHRMQRNRKTAVSTTIVATTAATTTTTEQKTTRSKRKS